MLDLYKELRKKLLSGIEELEPFFSQRGNSRALIILWRYCNGMGCLLARDLC